MKNSLLGASGLKPRGAPVPGPEEEKKPDQTRVTTAEKATTSDLAGGHEARTDETGDQLDLTGPTAPTRTAEDDTTHYVQAPQDERRENAPVPRPRRPTRVETAPQTIYFGGGEIDKAGDLAHAFKRSGRFKGLVRGHVGVSLVVRTALDMLLEEYKRDPAAALDRALRVASRGVR